MTDEEAVQIANDILWLDPNLILHSDHFLPIRDRVAVELMKAFDAGYVRRRESEKYDFNDDPYYEKP